MNTSHNYCLILAGGAGKRFWPVSRESLPKQFVPVTDLDTTFLRHTFDKFSKVVPQENILVVTTERYTQFVKDIIPELKDENLLVEPYIRDTAPSLTYASYKLLLRDPQATMVVTPADHLIKDEQAFVDTISYALEYASSHDELLVLGTLPTRADTNFGYIQKVGGSAMVDRPVRVKTFTEKPDASLAKVFVESGEFLWNAGVFIWNVKTITEEIEACMPLLASQFEGWQAAFNTAAEKKFIMGVYGGCEKQSISYGVLEKTRRASVYPAKYAWADFGEWQTYYEMIENKDASENAVHGTVITADSRKNVIITTQKDKMIAVQGLDSYLVVDTDDVLLICPKDMATYKQFFSLLNVSLPEKYK